MIVPKINLNLLGEKSQKNTFVFSLHSPFNQFFSHFSLIGATKTCRLEKRKSRKGAPTTKRTLWSRKER